MGPSGHRYVFVRLHPGHRRCGCDAFGLYALRLDGGKGRSGAGGIDFFKQGDSGNAADDLSEAGAAVKFRVSNTVLTYGHQMPALLVLS